jgi:sterol desaturase/sphingolipid hydroxylase (fatty acid hydroxylase superfamily)
MNYLEFLGPILIITSVLLLESFFPAQQNQKPISKGFVQDSAWFIGDHFIRLFVLAPYAHFLNNLTQHIETASLFNWNWMPIALRLLVAILLSDFLAWLSHVAMHKIPVLWPFHAIHHSQDEMNLFTDKRVHFIELFVVYSVVLIPMGLLKIPLIDASLYVFFQRWYLMVYHANIRSNYGVLKYFMVTPQSHRIHHSLESEHHNKNYGVMFNLWDRLFRTEHSSYQDYLKTGVRAPLVSKPNGASSLDILKTYFTQNIYPFLTISRTVINLIVVNPNSIRRD